ncbi:nuclear transcription factor Y subunit gamma-like isoform X4 [Nilaparvata lugens]|uniref:nuclear transcription factor Y subunit gamma-like isoform X3 n=1 Tax=Nilaparvata lugens TaxID=108931 RepID=UPI00193E3B6D|nr:nuclear transcription factor Y subunit gamma-like isoform X3 [Nilaparvata lugens]XP_039293832.1 nuclear transcription factor Y subunit gamma-like isoform X4 [Nilaparvata lugens]UBF19073.1 nuclear transcription factor Y subunit C [Nilaparvata lugens]
MSVFFQVSDNEVEGSASVSNGGEGSDSQKMGQLSEANQQLAVFWPKVTEEIRKIGQVRLDVKTQALPLARIKRIMKLDDEVKMISAEAPMLFSKAAELFIHELTLRAWVHTEDNKRRTLQRNDIAMAVTKYDQFDFLIDIVPRDEVKPPPRHTGGGGGGAATETRTSMNPDQIHYYFQLAQQHQAALQQNTTTNSTPQTIQVVQPGTGQIQAVTVQSQPEQQQQQGATTQPQVIQIQGATATATEAAAQPNIQILQQVVTPTGQVQQIPLQLNAHQMQMIRMQLQGNNTQPPIILQAAAAAPAQPQLIQVAQPNTNQGTVFLSQAATTNNSGTSGD